MSYSEYWDLFYIAQKKQCPFRAFTFDVKNSKSNKEYINNRDKYFKLIEYVYNALIQEEIKNNKKILIKDKFNQKYSNQNTNNNNYLNPMIIGDMFTFFVYENSMTQNEIVNLFIKGLKKLNINYDFHFMTGKYQTHDYKQGKSLLYKGYVPQMLEYLSKNNDMIINKNGILSQGKQR